MIDFILINDEEFVSSITFHEMLELRTTDYSRNVKEWLAEDYLFQKENGLRKPVEGLDYYSYQTLKTSIEGFSAQTLKTHPNEYSPQTAKTPNVGGRPKVEYFFSKELTKLIALNSKSKVKKQYVQWLLSLESKVENMELLNFDQIAYVMKLIQVFKYVAHQKQAEATHKEVFAANYTAQYKGKSDTTIYAEFHKYRNAILNIAPEIIKERIQRYCNENAYKPMTTKREQIRFLDSYESIKIAVFDFMKIAEKPDKASLKISAAAYEISKRMDIALSDQNIDDMFNEKEQLNERIIQRIQPKIKALK